MNREEAMNQITTDEWEEIYFLVRKERETTTQMYMLNKFIELSEKINRVLYPGRGTDDS